MRLTKRFLATAAKAATVIALTVALVALVARPTPASAQVRVKDKPKTNDVSVGSATNYILVEVTALGTNSTQLISIGHLISNTIPALLNLAGSTATNNAITNATSFGVFDQIAMGVFRYYNLEQGTNVILYRTPTSIVINATAPAGSGGGGGPGSLAADVTQLRTNTILQIIAGAAVTNLSALNLTNRGAFTNVGPAGFGDNLYVFGNTDIAGHLDVNGIGTFASVQVGAILTVNGALSSFAQDLTIGGPLTASGGVKIGNGQPIQALAILDVNTNVVGWISTNVIGLLSAATNALHTRMGNAEGATNGLTTRVNNIDGATNALNTRMANAEAATNLISSKQHGRSELSNLVGTVARNVTNVVSLSSSNANSKPLTNSYGSGVLTLYGLEAGSNITIGDNGSNKVISATAGGSIAWKSNDVAAATQSTANFTNGPDIQFILGEIGSASRVDIEAIIKADAVDFGQMQNVSAGVLAGRRTGSGVGDLEEVSPDNTTLEITSGAILRRMALTGDVTASAGSAATTIAANAVTDAKFRQSAARSLVGRSVNSAGNTADIQSGDNGYIFHQSNNVVLAGRVNLTNDSFANARFLNAAGGSVLQYHDNTGILTNKPITLTDSDSVTGVLPLANSTSNYNVLTAETVQTGGQIITNWQRLIGYSHFLRTTNLWADGGAGSLYSNTLFGISGGVSNLLWTNIQDGQDIVSWLFVSNGVSVGFPQFVASDFPDGAVVTPNTNCWTKIIVSRRNTTTNIQVFTAGFELAAGPGILYSTNFATRVITAMAAAVTTNLIGTVANNVTNENSAALQINNGTLTLSPGNASNLVNNTSIDFQPGNVISNVGGLKGVIWTNYVQTGSNYVFSFNTNFVEFKNQTNLIFTNIVEEATAIRGNIEIHIHNTTGVTMGLVWPAYGAQHGYFLQTNINNPIITTTSLATGQHGLASISCFGTNLFATFTTWP